MNGGYDYDILPTTWKARVLLALAFAFSPALVLLRLMLPVPAYESGNPCAPQGYPDCLQAQDALAADALDSCGGSGNHFCLVPLGRISPDLVRRLVEHYDQEYGLRVGMLAPIAIPEDLVNQDRGQVDALDLAELIETQFPRDSHNDYVILIGLTPVDMYIGTSDWRYAFGLRSPEPVISTSRMDPAFFGHSADDDLMASRARKLVSKYIGLFYYHLPPSDDPESPMFNNILSPADLDRMSEPLPVVSY